MEGEGHGEQPPEETAPLCTDLVAVRTGGLLRIVMLGLNVVSGAKPIEYVELKLATSFVTVAAASFS